jgi:hypothetical protein
MVSLETECRLLGAKPISVADRRGSPRGLRELDLKAVDLPVELACQTADDRGQPRPLMSGQADWPQLCRLSSGRTYHHPDLLRLQPFAGRESEHQRALAARRQAQFALRLAGERHMPWRQPAFAGSVQPSARSSEKRAGGSRGERGLWITMRRAAAVGR